MEKRYFPLAILLSLLGSWNLIVIKLALAYFPPFWLGTLRMLGIGLCMSLFLLAQKLSYLPSSPLGRRWLFYASLLKALSLVGIYAGLEKTSVVRATVIMMTSPLIAALVTPYFLPNDRPSWIRWGSIVLGFASVSVVLVPKWDHSQRLTGDLLIVAFVLLTRLLTIYQKKALLEKASPSQIVFWDALASFSLLSSLTFFLHEPLAFPSHITPWLQLFLLITLFGVFLFLFRRWMLQKVSVTFLASFQYLDWGFTTLFALLVLREPLPEHYGLGVFFLFLSLLFLHRDAVRLVSFEED